MRDRLHFQCLFGIGTYFSLSDFGTEQEREKHKRRKERERKMKNSDKERKQGQKRT